MAAACRAAAAAAQQAAPSIRLAVVGDVHSQWDADRCASQAAGEDKRVRVTYEAACMLFTSIRCLHSSSCLQISLAALSE